MISVLMSSYKEGVTELKLAVESILSQSYKDFEFIIIIDNPDNEIHKEVLSDYAKKDCRIRLFINDRNIGLVASLNKALSLAKGDYIARMDADDISISTRLEKQLKYLTKNEYDLIGGITQMINEDGTLLYSIQKIPSDFLKIKKTLKYGQCIAHPTWFGKREVFSILRGYRNIPLCEDYDFTLRAVLHGYKISNINEIVLKYRMTANSISRSKLFYQYLYMYYVSNEYKNGKIAEISNAKNFVEEKYTEIEAQKYTKANALFNEMLKELSDKKWLKLVRNGCKLLFISKYFNNKVFRFLMLRVNS